jgi:RNA-binding protein
LELTITSKQRAFLRSLSSKEDTILMVGKGGVTDTIIKQAEDALEARELIKGKVLESSPTAVSDVAVKLAEQTNSIMVQVIGFKFVLYRPNKEKKIIALPRK